MKILFASVLTLLLSPAFGQTYMQDEDMIYEDQPLQGEMTTDQPRGLEREPGGEYVELPQEEEFDPDAEAEMDMEEEATSFGDEEYVE